MVDGLTEYPVLEKTDDQLMAAYARGDERAFERLYRRHRGGMWRYLLRLVGPTQCADAFQDTWARIIAGRDRFRRDLGGFSAWAYRIAHNVGVDTLRRSTLRATDGLDEDPMGDAAPPPAVVAARDEREAFIQCFDRLPPAQKEAWVLKEERGFDLNLIGRITGVNRETVKSRLRYAIGKMKQCLETALT